MATRVSTLDYRVTGAEASSSRVRTLSQALEAQKRNAQAAVPALAAAQRGTGFLGAVNASSAQQVMLMSGALGPLGAGLAHVATRAPAAAGGMMAFAAAHERLGLLSRVTNAALLGGAATMAAGAAMSVGYANAILRGADAYAAMTARINTFSDGAVAAAQNERALYDRAMEARTGVEGLTTLFVRISPAIEDMGRAQSAALQITESVSKALAVQGATTAETTSATVQLSQALASGVLRGDEFRSLMESAPQLMRYISQNITIDGKTGVAFGQLRALANEGKLTAQLVMDAMLRARESIESDFATAPKTASQGWVVLKDQVTRTVGEISKVTGLQQGVFNFLDGLAKKLDGFRKEALLNPDSFEPVVRAGEIFGDTLERAGQLAKGVVEHFDLILSAAQALIALKIGEVLAGGFAMAAAKAREVYASTRAFMGQGAMLAAHGMDEAGTVAAINARAAANTAAARAEDLNTQAVLRGRTAVAARAAADVQAAHVTRLKATAGVQATVVAEAEARANALNTAAERAEAAAKSATTAANNAQTASSTRLAIAQQAEALATRNVTVGMAAKAVGMRVLGGLYAMLGGSIGIVTMVLGGLIYATWQSKQAWDEKIRTLRDAAVVSDELEAVSRAMTSASWAEVPALLASADALREKATAAREAAQAIRDQAKAEADRLDETKGLSAAFGDVASGANNNMAASARRAQAAAQSVLDDAAQDEWRQKEADRQTDLRARTVEARARLEENRNGMDAAGRAISAARRQENESVVAAARAAGMAAVEAAEREIRDQNGAISRTSGAEQQNLRKGLTVHNRTFEAAAELATVGTDRTTPTPTPASGGGRKSGRSGMSAEDRAVSNLLERVQEAADLRALMGQPAPTSSRFSVKDGKLYDGESLFVGRSEDEARAAQEYLKQIKAITEAKASLVTETGMTREALSAQAAQTLATALSTSQATEAERRWQERLAEARGESTAAAQAEREVSEARKQGVSITEEAIDAYIRMAVAKDKARRAEEALNAARPVVAEVTRNELDGMGAMPERWRTDVGGMGFDVDAALREWAAARERISAEVERRIRAEQERQVREGLKTREQADTDVSAQIAAAKVATELESAQQVADIWRRQRDDDQQAWRDRLEERLAQERQIADSVTGALEDLAFGADAEDIGKRFMNDLLRSMWQEIVTNPLNLMIRNAFREMASGQGGGSSGGGFWTSVVNTVGSFLSGGGGSAPGHADGGLPGFTTGGLPGVKPLPTGLIRGPGGPRDDRILARVSNREFISNARATQDHYGLLTAMNAGRVRRLEDVVPYFADGGLPGGQSIMGAMLAREIMNGEFDYRPPAATTDRDRISGRSGGDAVVDLSVNVINQTETPVEARAMRTPEGVDVILSPLVRAEVARMGADGSLNRAASTAPKPRRR